LNQDLIKRGRGTGPDETRQPAAYGNGANSRRTDDPGRWGNIVL